MPDRVVARPRSVGIADASLAPATALVIVAMVILLLMSPIWMHFALDLSGGASCSHVTIQPNCVLLSDRTVSELIFGPGTFAAFAADEAGHLRDVRLVLYSFLALALVSVALLVWRVRASPRDPQTWRWVARGGAALVVTIVALGVFATLAFGVAFELFHRILFPGGNWSFSPDSLLIRLYPYVFWQLSAAAFGILAICGGAMVWLLATRRARALQKASGS